MKKLIFEGASVFLLGIPWDSFKQRQQSGEIFFESSPVHALKNHSEKLSITSDHLDSSVEESRDEALVLRISKTLFKKFAQRSNEIKSPVKPIITELQFVRETYPLRKSIEPRLENYRKLIRSLLRNFYPQLKTAICALR